MGKYTKILETKAMKQLESKKDLHETVYRRSKEIFKISKQQMLAEFKEHPVTREIEGGPDASNISNTIVGVGNLYSFIGFDNGTHPVRSLYNLLNTGTFLSGKRARVVKKTKKSVYLGFKVNYPSERDITSVTSMPWEPGSWALRIERGMSGLGYYMYEKYIKASRSGSGIQVKSKVRTGMFKRTSYLSAILNTFKKNFTK